MMGKRRNFFWAVPGSCFQVFRRLTYPRDSQVHRILFRAKSLKGGKLSNFVGDLSVGDVFRIAIVSRNFLNKICDIVDYGECKEIRSHKISQRYCFDEKFSNTRFETLVWAD